MKGKFIVIEGIDCTGKATQAKLLVKKLKEIGKKVVYLDFPTYEKTPGGIVVKWYLEGKFGTLSEVPPELAVLVYAIDRYQFAKENKKALEEGKILISNRYTQSNIGHQASKFKNKEREKFIRWIKEVESRMPQPDIIIYLDLPIEISLKLKRSRDEAKGAKEKDIHEKDIEHLKNARECYLETGKKEGWIIINCFDELKKDIKDKEEIHREILKKLRERNII